MRPSGWLSLPARWSTSPVSNSFPTSAERRPEKPEHVVQWLVIILWGAHALHSVHDRAGVLRWCAPSPTTWSKHQSRFRITAWYVTDTRFREIVAPRGDCTRARA